MSLYLRHMLWTALCPGTVTLIIPWTLTGFALPASQRPTILLWAGVVLVCVGAMILISCILMFAKYGEGTLSPFDPARKLVIRGLYKYVRNPMYVGVMVILIGEVMWLRSIPMMCYTIGIFVAFNLFIIFYEEPYLHKEFGRQYDAYKKSVGRWIPGKPSVSS